MSDQIMEAGRNVNTGARILIVEDEPSIADNLLYSLDSEGFVALACGTGAEALERFQSDHWDLVVLDIGLPDISGFEVCRRLFAIRNTPLIFLTARGSEVDRVVGLELGADDYVVKPFSPRELTARVRAVLRRTAKQDCAAAPAHRPETQPIPIEVDEQRCLIRYFGKALELPRYEFRLLKALARHPGRVFSRAQLMDLSSEEPEAALERTVDVHIKSLRAAMRTIRPSIDPIRTCRGLGYSLIEQWNTEGRNS